MSINTLIECEGMSFCVEYIEGGLTELFLWTVWWRTTGEYIAVDFVSGTTLLYCSVFVLIICGDNWWISGLQFAQVQVGPWPDVWQSAQRQNFRGLQL